MYSIDSTGNRAQSIDIIFLEKVSPETSLGRLERECVERDRERAGVQDEEGRSL
eukprot:COSAG02_NODE_1195_length_13940_cov_15.482407_1_plen_54_part_00